MIRHIEELSLNAWASLQTVVYDGWLIRFSNGYTKRANSVNPIYGSTEDLDYKIHYCEDVFRARNLKPVFKMTESVYPKSLDATLEERGYIAIDHTSVQSMSLSQSKEPSIHTVKVHETLNDEWLNQFCILNNQDKASKATMKQMLSLILPKTGFFSLNDNEVVVACGLGVLERGYLGIFDIVTHSHFRNRGFGEQLMLNLLKWGKENGAKHAYLQAMLTNGAALGLYSKLGFQERYRYWYRIKE
ncbi:GNAT family N-acetyltransferase [Alicyclobacillus fastidiosus]|uniref:GNAT family N-acetyltransferase n=1 Tax=Alicyclobacillus fastidiosus TaxID=392011 RepID=A0ABV5AC95_9BACL|nr:GNAT family N-acetyltransferase [Alicyclobacillus fastidiosus]WEH11468.1 GNAT family N-acetyltransferase [Alicyclobacillus fastidiosus]